MTILSVTCFAGSSEYKEETKKSIPITKILIACTIVGVSLYFRADIRKFITNNFTAENLEAARKITVDEVIKPVAQSVKKEGPKMVREYLARIIVCSLLGGLTQLF